MFTNTIVPFSVAVVDVDVDVVVDVVEVVEVVAGVVAVVAVSGVGGVGDGRDRLVLSDTVQLPGHN